eukprot:560447-Prymnesium_polylepis.1
MQVLALSEKLPRTNDEGYRGILVHNIGFCLHCLGELEAAKAYYQQSIDLLEREQAEMPVAKRVLNGLMYPDQLVTSALYGSPHANRIRMTCAASACAASARGHAQHATLRRVSARPRATRDALFLSVWPVATVGAVRGMVRCKPARARPHTTAAARSGSSTSPLGGRPT